MIGVVEASIEIDGNVSGLPARTVGGFLRKWLHISWDQHHLAKPEVPFFCTKSHTKIETVGG